MAISGQLSRSGGRLLPRCGRALARCAALRLGGLEDDHVLVHRLERGVGQAGAAVEEAPLQEIEEGELQQRARGQAVEELLLVEAPPVEVALQQRAERAEGFAVRAVGEDLLRLEAAVSVVAGGATSRTPFVRVGGGENTRNNPPPPPERKHVIATALTSAPRA